MPRLEALPNTPQWVAARRGCLTASRMAEVVVRKAVRIKKNGEPYKDSGEYTAKRMAYARDIVAERVAGFAKNHFVSDAMQWGIDQEPNAAEAYEAETGVICGPAGYYLHDTIEHFGATPDRLVGRDGLVQFKCPETHNYIKWVLEDEVPEQHKPQMLVELAVMRRKWNDFVAFDPRVQSGPQIFIRRFEPTAEEIEAVEAEARKFLTEVEAMFQLFTTGSLEATLRASLKAAA